MKIKYRVTYPLNNMQQEFGSLEEARAFNKKWLHIDVIVYADNMEELKTFMVKNIFPLDIRYDD